MMDRFKGDYISSYSLGTIKRFETIGFLPPRGWPPLYRSRQEAVYITRLYPIYGKNRAFSILCWNTVDKKRLESRST